MYSAKFKEEIVQRMLSGSDVGVARLAEEAGVAASTLHRWRRDSLAPRTAEDSNGDAPETKGRRELTALGKARLIAEADRVDEQAMGAWLRARGLRRADLEQWRAAVEEALDPAKARRRKKDEDKCRAPRWMTA